MMWLYQLLDTIATLSESVILYFIINTLCTNRRGRYAKWIPPVIYFLLSWFWTWFIVDGTFKLPFGIIIVGFVIKECYGESLAKGWICLFLHYTVIAFGSTSAVLIVSTFSDTLSIVIGEMQFMRWPVYLFYCAINLAFAGIIKFLLKNFQYTIERKDFGIIFLMYLPGCFVFHIQAVAFLDGSLNWFSLKEELLVFALSGGFILLFLYLKNYYNIRDKAKQDQMMLEQLKRQFAYYQDKQKDEERVQSIYHDMKNHLLILQAQAGNGHELQKSIRELQNQIQEYENYYHTGNEFLDIIIRDKAKKAQEEQIDFSVNIYLEDGSFIEPLDISTIFGNALDNAIEASEKLPVDQRLITVKADRVRDMMVILVENNTLPDCSVQIATTKKDTFIHGFGIPNIKNAVEKYGGQCSIKTENGVYTLKIVIPISE